MKQTRLNYTLTALLADVNAVEQLTKKEKTLTNRVEKKKNKLQIQTYMLDIEEKIRSIKLQDFRNFKADIKELATNNETDTSDNDDNK